MNNDDFSIFNNGDDIFSDDDDIFNDDDDDKRQKEIRFWRIFIENKEGKLAGLVTGSPDTDVYGGLQTKHLFASAVVSPRLSRHKREEKNQREKSSVVLLH